MNLTTKRYLALGAFLLFMAMCLALPVVATAAAPSTVITPQITNSVTDKTVTLSWTAPTVYIDDTPITEVISYNLYEGLCSLEDLPKVVGPVTVLTLQRTNQPSGTMCYQITAQTPNGGESQRTNRGSKTFPWPKPNTAPTLTVQ